MVFKPLKMLRTCVPDPSSLKKPCEWMKAVFRGTILAGGCVWEKNATHVILEKLENKHVAYQWA